MEREGWRGGRGRGVEGKCRFRRLIGLYMEWGIGNLGIWGIGILEGKFDYIDIMYSDVMNWFVILKSFVRGWRRMRGLLNREGCVCVCEWKGVGWMGWDENMDLRRKERKKERKEGSR